MQVKLSFCIFISLLSSLSLTVLARIRRVMVLTASSILQQSVGVEMGLLLRLKLKVITIKVPYCPHIDHFLPVNFWWVGSVSHCQKGLPSVFLLNDDFKTQLKAYPLLSEPSFSPTVLQQFCFSLVVSTTKCSFFLVPLVCGLRRRKKWCNKVLNEAELNARLKFIEILLLVNSARKLLCYFFLITN